VNQTQIAAAFQTQRWFRCRIPNARLVVSPLFNFMNSKQRNSNCICKLPRKAKQLEGKRSGGRTRGCRRENVSTVCRILLPWIIAIYPMIFFNTLIGI